MYNALESSDEVSRLFPEGHELYQLARPTFNTIRRALAGPWISCIWNDAKEDPTRAGFRRSYDDVYGPGSVNVMPAIATWLSTGPGQRRRRQPSRPALRDRPQHGAVRRRPGPAR